MSQSLQSFRATVFSFENLVETLHLRGTDGGDLHIERKEVAHSLWRNSSAAYCIAILLPLVHAQGIMHLRIVKPYFKPQRT